ncbi:MAG: hypothetical protein DDT42_02019 [candidate division WS2 bacterium]|uniref:Uncharacterized protein n=1 Tax=Psychracetigena formicireducens TaxID=2986056 RepID=A0A9E2BJ54_PSYF1|nr:hypothetical protein [Candidatus Psychracetigena formicireducens]
MLTITNFKEAQELTATKVFDGVLSINSPGFWAIAPDYKGTLVQLHFEDVLLMPSCFIEPRHYPTFNH